LTATDPARAALRLTRLALTDFRNYASLDWSPGTRLVVISGPNGSGKTNLLEAISLLLPGRGLRGARSDELARVGDDATGSWAVSGRFVTPEGPLALGTGTLTDSAPAGRTFRLDGAKPRTQAEITARIAMVWLTPQMERLFQEPPSGRRRFFDRLVWALHPGHAREVAAFETAMAGRNRLLVERRREDVWLAALEDAMARHAVAVTAARLALMRRLNEAPLTAPSTHGFPPVRVILDDAVSARLAEHPALAVEDWLRHELARGRGRDAASGGAALGSHRTDVILADAATGITAARASTGQQKAMLVGLILGHARMIENARGFAPLLLLDEPLVHLDGGRRAALFAALAGLSAQAFLTGTDADLFADLRGAASGYVCAGGTVLSDADFTGPAPGTDG